MVGILPGYYRIAPNQIISERDGWNPAKGVIPGVLVYHISDHQLNYDTRLYMIIIVLHYATQNTALLTEMSDDLPV